MHEQQLAQEPELTDGDVRTASRLQTFMAADADAYMCGLDHTHIVGTIANRQENRACVCLDKFDDQRLLQGRYSATHYCLALGSKAEESIRHGCLQSVLQAAAFDDQRELVDGIGMCFDRRELLVDHRCRVSGRSLIHDQQIHRLRDEPAGVPDVDRSLLAITRQHPHVNASRLQRRDRIRHALLQLVFNCRRTQQVHIPLEFLSYSIQRSLASVKLGSGCLVPLCPCLVLRRLERATRNAERPQTIGRIRLEVLERHIYMWLGGPQSRQNDSVRAFAIHDDAPIRLADDRRHPLAC